MRGRALLAVGLLWGLGQASCGAQGPSGGAGPGGCGDLSGVWTVSGSCAPGACTVTQSGCSLMITCASGTQLSGTVSGAAFAGTGTTAAREAGMCTGTFASGVLDGTCSTAAGACTITARCATGACGATPSASADTVPPAEFCSRVVAAHGARRAALGCTDLMLMCAPGLIRVQDLTLPNHTDVRRASSDQCAAGLAAAQDCDELLEAFIACTRLRQM